MFDPDLFIGHKIKITVFNMSHKNKNFSIPYYPYEKLKRN